MDKDFDAALAPAGQRKPDFELKVSLSRADKEKSPYFLVPFDVPAGVTRIEVRYRYRQTEDCVIDLGAGDPTADGVSVGLKGCAVGAAARATALSSVSMRQRRATSQGR